MVNELKRSATPEFVPGVNVLGGLAEDAMAVLQVVHRANSGRQEISASASDLERKMSAANRQPIQPGIRSAEILERVRNQLRTV